MQFSRESKQSYIYLCIIVLQNNLVCSKKLYRTHAIVAYMAGYMIGSFGIGIFSDKYDFIYTARRTLVLDEIVFLLNCLICRFGRKVVLMASIVLYIGSSIPLSFVNEFIGFTVLHVRSFSGVSVGGLLSTCYVMGKST